MTKMIAVSLMTLSAGVALAGCGESESFDVRTQTTTQSTVTASNSTADATHRVGHVQARAQGAPGGLRMFVARQS